MKNLGFVRDVVGTADDKNHHIYEANDGIFVRDIEINAGIGKEVTIGVVSDLHFNYCNQQDFDEANPVVMASYKNRICLTLAVVRILPKPQNLFFS